MVPIGERLNQPKETALFIVSSMKAEFGPTQGHDEFEMFDRFGDAKAAYQGAIDGGASCVAISVPIEGTEPQWVDDGINLSDMLETAQCLWEASLDLVSGPIFDYRATVGCVDFREKLRDVNVLTACHKGWRMAQDFAGFDGSFDWEFCPWFLQNCFEADGRAFSLREDWRELCTTMNL